MALHESLSSLSPSRWRPGRRDASPRLPLPLLSLLAWVVFGPGVRATSRPPRRGGPDGAVRSGAVLCGAAGPGSSILRTAKPTGAEPGQKKAIPPPSFVSPPQKIKRQQLLSLGFLGICPSCQAPRFSVFLFSFPVSLFFFYYLFFLFSFSFPLFFLSFISFSPHRE